MKKAIVFALLALMMFAAQGQQFEWAKGCGSTGEGCTIIGSVTDNDGNFYFVGKFPNYATWEGESLLPIGPYGPVQGGINTIIAKISPAGEMLWKKVIISNNGQGHIPYDIKMVGDTAFACLVEITMPSYHNYTYYLDTLLLSWSDYPVRAWGVETHLRTAYILFDFEGNVKEQHFLHLSYTDANGDDIVTYYDSEPWYGSRCFYLPSFDIDADGNIYICREAADKLYNGYDASSGTIKGVKYWVDNRVAGWHPIENNPPYWVPILMKFSPHFDTLLAYRYVVQKWDNIMRYDPLTLHLMVDSQSNAYLTVHQETYGQNNTIVVDSTLGLSFFHDNKIAIKDYLVKTNSLLQPQWLITLDDSVINPSAGPAGLEFHDVAIDYDSNLLFIVGTTGRGTLFDTVNIYSILTYQGIPLSLKNGAFFLAFKMGNTHHPELYSYGQVNAKWWSYAIPAYGSFGNIACGNNRLFFQSKYRGDVRTLDTIINIPDKRVEGMGLHIFDYRGHATGIINYTAAESAEACDPTSISLVDSVIYLSASIEGEMSFGGHTVASATGWVGACIAKYVDPAFMLPYVYTGPSDVRIVLVDDGDGAFVVYPNPFRSSVKIKVDGGSLLERDGAATATLTDMQGRQEQVRLTPEGPSTYRLDLSTTRTFRHSGNQAIFLTLTTSAGKQHTVRLLQQADLFGN